MLVVDASCEFGMLEKECEAIFDLVAEAWYGNWCNSTSNLAVTLAVIREMIRSHKRWDDNMFMDEGKIVVMGWMLRRIVENTD